MADIYEFDSKTTSVVYHDETGEEIHLASPLKFGNGKIKFIVTTYTNRVHKLEEAKLKKNLPGITRRDFGVDLQRIIEENAGFKTWLTGYDDSQYLENMSLWNYLLKNDKYGHKKDPFVFKKWYIAEVMKIAQYDRVLCLIFLNRLHPKLDSKYFEKIPTDMLRYFVVKTFGFAGRFHFPDLLYLLLGDYDSYKELITFEHAVVFINTFTAFYFSIDNCVDKSVQNYIKGLYNRNHSIKIQETHSSPMSFPKSFAVSDENVSTELAKDSVWEEIAAVKQKLENED